jgi:hypothetical protein
MMLLWKREHLGKLYCIFELELFRGCREKASGSMCSSLCALMLIKLLAKVYNSHLHINSLSKYIVGKGEFTEERIILVNCIGVNIKYCEY